MGLRKTWVNIGRPENPIDTAADLIFFIISEIKVTV